MEYAVVPFLPLRPGFPNLLLSSLLLPLSTDVVVSAIIPHNQTAPPSSPPSLPPHYGNRAPLGSCGDE